MQRRKSKEIGKEGRAEGRGKEENQSGNKKKKWER